MASIKLNYPDMLQQIKLSIFTGDHSAIYSMACAVACIAASFSLITWYNKMLNDPYGRLDMRAVIRTLIVLFLTCNFYSFVLVPFDSITHMVTKSVSATVDNDPSGLWGKVNEIYSSIEEKSKKETLVGQFEEEMESSKSTTTIESLSFETSAVAESLAETTIQDLSVKLEDMLKLKKLLKGKEGDTETVTFEGEFHNSDDAPKWFESAAGFTPNLTGEVSTGGENADSGSDEGEYALTGFVDKYPVTMSLNIGVTNVNGTYYYDSKGPTKKLKLVGTNDDGVLDLNETDANGTPTGHFKGKFKGGVFKGVFVTNQGKKMPFELSEDGSVSSVDLSFDEDFDDDDDDEMDYSSNSSSDEIDDTDVDRYIDEYEKFWRDYVSFIKKMDKNDPTAMIEYSKMMSKIQSLDEKGKKLKGKMSTRQLERLNKMHMELMELMQKLN